MARYAHIFFQVIFVDWETGATIDLGSWSLTEESVREYLDATGDDLGIYSESGLAPPLALCAYALGVMLEKLSLPPGTIHSIQEMEVLAPVTVGESLQGAAVPERPRSRGGLRFLTVSYTVTNHSGDTVQTGKTTVLAPDTESEAGRG